MGYDLHITRADDWSENDGQKITAEEWIEIINEDPELLPDPPNGVYSVLWKGKSGSQDPWFDWFDGNIFTTNPDRAVVEKMLQIAAFLHAKVQGDNGEIYSSVLDWPE